MAKELTLELSKSQSEGQRVCPLCKAIFRLFGTAGMLSVGDVVLGHLCEKCLLSGPKGAAARVRARANELRSLLASSDRFLSGEEWVRLHRSIWKRVDDWDSLAARIEKMRW